MSDITPGCRERTNFMSIYLFPLTEVGNGPNMSNATRSFQWRSYVELLHWSLMFPARPFTGGAFLALSTPFFHRLSTDDNVAKRTVPEEFLSLQNVHTLGHHKVAQTLLFVTTVELQVANDPLQTFHYPSTYITSHHGFSKIPTAPNTSSLLRCTRPLLAKVVCRRIPPSTVR